MFLGITLRERTPHKGGMKNVDEGIQKNTDDEDVGVVRV
jgi:hypothetical protein